MFLHRFHFCIYCIFEVGIDQSVERLDYGLDDRGSVVRFVLEEIYFLFYTAPAPALGHMLLVSNERYLLSRSGRVIIEGVWIGGQIY